MSEGDGAEGKGCKDTITHTYHISRSMAGMRSSNHRSQSNVTGEPPASQSIRHARLGATAGTSLIPKRDNGSLLRNSAFAVSYFRLECSRSGHRRWVRLSFASWGPVARA